jgi:hypothetical protein
MGIRLSGHVSRTVKRGSSVSWSETRKERDHFEKLSIILKWNVKCMDLLLLTQDRDGAGPHKHGDDSSRSLKCCQCE